MIGKNETASILAIGISNHQNYFNDNAHIPAQPNGVLVVSRDLNNNNKKQWFQQELLLAMSLSRCCFDCKIGASDKFILDTCLDDELRCLPCKQIRWPVAVNKDTQNTTMAENDITSIKDSLKFLCQKTVESDLTLKNLVETVQGLEKNVSSLKNQLQEKDKIIDDLCMRVDSLEQKDKNNNLVVTGYQLQSFAGLVSGNDTDNPSNKNHSEMMAENFIKFAGDILEVNVTKNDIAKIYPVKNNKDDKKTSRIVFENKGKKTEIFRAKKKLFEKHIKGVYVNEDLTSRNFNLLMKSRKLRQERKVEFVWTMDCQIFVKTYASNRQAAKTFVIRSEADFDRYKLN